MAEGDRAEIVVFDLGGVLIDWDPRYLYRTLFDDPEAMEVFLRDVASSPWNERFDAGRPLDEGIAELVLLHPHLEAPLRAWKSRWIEMVKGPIHGTVAILDELVEQGVRLAALTNWSVETFPLVRDDDAYPFFAHFQNIYVSGALRLIKPDPQIFAHVEEDLRVSPEALLFIDDNPANVAAARARGWQAHRFVDPKGLRGWLVGHGLLAAAA